MWARMAMPRSASRPQMCDATRGPKASRGACSGVTMTSPTSCRSLGAHVLAGHQRQLVERQGPADRGGTAKATRCTRPASRSSSRALKAATSRGPREGQGARNRHVGGGTHRDQQRVVLQRVAAHGAHLAAPGIDRREAVAPAGARRGRQRCRRDRSAAQRAPPNGSATARWRSTRVGVGLEQLDLCAGSEVGAQGDERFETGDPAAGDDDAGHAVEARAGGSACHP